MKKPKQQLLSLLLMTVFILTFMSSTALAETYYYIYANELDGPLLQISEAGEFLPSVEYWESNSIHSGKEEDGGTFIEFGFHLSPGQPLHDQEFIGTDPRSYVRSGSLDYPELERLVKDIVLLGWSVTDKTRDDQTVTQAAIWEAMNPRYKQVWGPYNESVTKLLNCVSNLYQDPRFEGEGFDRRKNLLYIRQGETVVLEAKNIDVSHSTYIDGRKPEGVSVKTENGQLIVSASENAEVTRFNQPMTFARFGKIEKGRGIFYISRMNPPVFFNDKAEYLDQNFDVWISVLPKGEELPEIRNPYNTILELYDREGNPIDGTFELRDEDGIVHFMKELDGYRMVPAGTEGATTQLQSEHGILKLIDLDPDAHYTLYESSINVEPILDEPLEIEEPDEGTETIIHINDPDDKETVDVELTMEDKDGNPLDGSYSLYDEDGIVYFIEDEDGYVVVPEGTEGAITEITPKDGKLNIKGLDPEKSYELHEVTPPTDFPPSDEPIPLDPAEPEITIVDDRDPVEPEPEPETFHAEITMEDKDGNPLDGSYSLYDEDGIVYFLEDEDGYVVVPEGTEGAITEITPKDGKLNIKGLDPEKSYELHEVTPPTDFPPSDEPIPLDPAKPEITIVDDRDPVEPEPEPETFHAEITMEDKDGNPLDGSYSLYDEDGIVYFIEDEDGYVVVPEGTEGAITEITPKDGKLNIKGLDPEKSYELHEVTPPRDFPPSDEPIPLDPAEPEITIVDDRDPVEPEPETFDAEITMEDKDGNPLDGSYSLYDEDGIVYFLEDEDGYVVVPEGTEGAITEITPKDGKLNIKGLDPEKSYELHEVTPPRDFPPSDEPIPLDPAEPEITIVDDRDPVEPEPETFDAEITMEDKDGNPLDGSYSLYDEDGIVYFLEDEDGYVVVPEGTEGAITEITPKDGKLNIKGLDPEKSYELHEVTPPTDFPPSDEPIPLDPAEPEITIVDDRDPVEPEPETFHAEITMEDKDGNPLDGSYSLYDEDGIVYFIEDEDGYVVVPEGTEGAITEITPKDGKLNIKGLDPEKSYELHEVTPPTDFPPSDEPIPLDPAEPEITIVDDRDPVEPEPEPETFHAEITMEDKDGNPLDGSYSLYDEDGIVYFIEDEDGYVVVPEGTEGAITEITPKDGKLNIKGLDPEKSYILEDNDQENPKFKDPIKIEADEDGGSVQIEIKEDERQDYNVMIHLISDYTDAPLNAIYQLLDGDQSIAFLKTEEGYTLVDTLVEGAVHQLVSENGELKLIGLDPEKTYTLEEVLPPANFKPITEGIVIKTNSSHDDLSISLNYVPVPGGLHLIQKLEESEERIESATYALFDENQSPVLLSGEDGIYTVSDFGQDTFQTTNGEAKIRGLEVGTYTLKLIDQSLDYEQADYSQTFEVKANELTEITVLTSLHMTTLQLKQVDEATGAPITMKGFTFRLSRDEEGTELIEDAQGLTDFKTDEKGQIHFPALANGSYYLWEINTPNPYLPETRPYEIVLDGTQGTVYEIQFRSTAQMGQIHVQKQGPKLQGFDKEIVVTKPAASVSMLQLDVPQDRERGIEDLKPDAFTDDTIQKEAEYSDGDTYDDTDNTETLNADDEDIEQAVKLYRLIKADGTVIEENLSFQDGPIERVLSAGTYYLEQIGETNTRYTFEHEGENDETSTLWTPRFANGPLQDVVYGIYADETIYNLPFESEQREVIYEAGDLVEQITTDELGEASSDNLPLGRYKLVELTTRSGYKAMNEPINVQLVPSGKAVNIQILDEDLNQGRQTYHVHFLKDFERSAVYQDLDELNQATTFGLYNEIALNIDGHILPEGTLLGLASPIISNEGGSEVVFDAPFATTYTIKELHTHEVYRPANDQRVKLDWDPQLKTVVQELPAVYNELQRSSITVTKLDEVTGKGLAGVKFALYRRALDATQDDIYIGEWATDSDGKVTIESLEKGRYYVKEIQALPGYLHDDAKWSVHVAADKNNYELTLYNAQTVTQIQKRDKVTNLSIEGANLRLMDEDGNEIANWISDGKPYTLRGLIPNQIYTLYEDHAPLGYATAKELQFTVNPDGALQIVDLYNQETITDISAVDATDSKIATKARLRLKRLDDETVIREWDAGEKAERFYGLYVGEDYVIEEVHTPDGYQAMKPLKFTVPDTSNIHRVIVKHTPIGVEPTDTDDDEPGDKSDITPSEDSDEGKSGPGDDQKSHDDKSDSKPTDQGSGGSGSSGGSASPQEPQSISQTGENPNPYIGVSLFTLLLAICLWVIKHKLFMKPDER